MRRIGDEGSRDPRYHPDGKLAVAVGRLVRQPARRERQRPGQRNRENGEAEEDGGKLGQAVKPTGRSVAVRWRAAEARHQGAHGFTGARVYQQSPRV